jgi:hypothetical protein
VDKKDKERKKRKHEQNKSSWGHGSLCCKERQKGKMQDNQDKGTITDEVQAENKRTKYRWVRGYFYLLSVVCYAGRKLCDGSIVRPGESCRVCLTV